MFTGTVTNTGNVTLIGVVVLSTQPAPNTTVFGPITLAPGAGTNFSGSYKIPANMCSMESLRERLELENEYLKTEVRENFSGLIGKSSALQKVRQKIELVAPTESSVMIIGESGTGKELIALAIHDRSKRRERALVRVNCASIPRELFESEFFGHVRGSFTGAVRDRAGPFQLAHGGTLFLDEVGEIPLDLQSKLLRVLSLVSFEPVMNELEAGVGIELKVFKLSSTSACSITNSRIHWPAAGTESFLEAECAT